MNKKLKIILILGILVIGSMPVSAGIVKDFVKTVSVGLTELVEKVLGWISDKINGFVEALLSKIIWFLTWNPDITMVKPLIDDFIELLTPLYIIAFIIIGLYFFFLSESPKGRARARSALLKLLLSLAFVISATTIYQFLLDLSELLVNFVLNLVAVDLGPAAQILVIYMSTYPLFWIIYMNVLLLLLVIFAIRYVLLLVMAAIFPLTIFFFFFELTKNYGRKLMRYTFMLIFTPVIQAIVLIFFIATMNNIGGAETAAGNFAVIAIGFAGFVLMIIAPWMALGLLKWFGGILCFAAFQQMFAGRMRAAMGLFLAGGLMMGEGPGAIPMAATLWFIGQLEHRSHEVGHELLARPRRVIKTKRTGRGGGRGKLPKKRGPGWIPGGVETPRGETPLADARIAGDRFMEEGYRLKRDGKESLAKERFKRARNRYRKVMELSDRAERRGEIRGRTEVKLTDIEKAEVYAKMGEANEQLGNTRRARLNYEKAIRSYKRAIKRESDPKKKAEYTKELAECTTKLADVLYRRG